MIFRTGIWFISIFILIYGCEKQQSPIVRNSAQYSAGQLVNVAWQVRADSTGQPASGREPLVWNDKVLWSNAKMGEGYSIRLSDGLTGSEIWRWKDFIKYPDLPFHNFHFISEHYYAFNNIQETHVIDLHNGTSLWSTYDQNAGAYINDAGTFLYGKINDRDFQPQICTLRKTPVANFSWSPVLTLEAKNDSGFSPAIFGPSLWISPGEDSILVFQNRSWNFNTSMGKVDLWAYDISNDSLYFKLVNIEPSQNSNVAPPIIDGQRIYLMGQKNLHCVDLISREILWQKGFPGAGHHLMLSNLVIDRDILIVNADDHRIYGFNKFTGKLLWCREGAGASPSPMQLADDVVYYVSEADGRLYGVRTSDGAIVLSLESPNIGREDCPAAAFHGGLAINPNLGLIYAHDHHFFMAIKMKSQM